jgi:mannose-6-phosphate isomerase-like protein (cupin superfamily)
MDVRRVVTGHSADGKAVFASDEAVPPITLALVPGAEFHRLWGADAPMHFPDDGARPRMPSYFPPVGGYRVGMFSVAPATTVVSAAALDIPAAFAEMETTLPGLAAYLEPANPGMHTTATVDFEYVISGRCVLELDDGATVELAPGDTVVQNGTRHAWRNPFSEPCVMLVVLVGANHDRIPAVGTD